MADSEERPQSYEGASWLEHEVASLPTALNAAIAAVFAAAARGRRALSRLRGSTRPPDADDAHEPPRRSA
jgi:hypothetical protein